MRIAIATLGAVAALAVVSPSTGSEGICLIEPWFCGQPPPSCAACTSPAAPEKPGHGYGRHK